MIWRMTNMMIELSDFSQNDLEKMNDANVSSQEKERIATKNISSQRPRKILIDLGVSTEKEEE